jgi:hypothetical protein
MNTQPAAGPRSAAALGFSLEAQRSDLVPSRLALSTTGASLHHYPVPPLFSPHSCCPCSGPHLARSARSPRCGDSVRKWRDFCRSGQRCGRLTVDPLSPSNVAVRSENLTWWLRLLVQLFADDFCGLDDPNWQANQLLVMGEIRGETYAFSLWAIGITRAPAAAYIVPCTVGETMGVYTWPPR